MWKCCLQNCARMYTRKGRTTPRRRFRKKLLRTAWEFTWRLWAIRRNIPRANCCRRRARLGMTEPRFLVVRLGSLGDIVHAFPAVSGLRTSFPNAEVIWLTHPKWEFLIKTAW